MTHEQVGILTRRVFLAAIFTAIVSGAWYASWSGSDSPDRMFGIPVGSFKTSDKKTEARPIPKFYSIHRRLQDDPEDKQLDKIMKTIVSPENGLAIVHYHLPGDPASEELADNLNYIQQKYGRQVLVVRIGFDAYPEILKTRGVVRLPHVIMIVGTQPVFEFQGLWSQIKLERKVDEILHGLLKRVGKDWRPPVPGMRPVGG